MSSASQTGGDPARHAAASEVLIAGRYENIWPLAICVAFALLGLWLGLEGKGVGWFCLLIFGAGAAVLGDQALRNDRWRLDLHDKGFTVVNPFNRVEIAWREVETFGVWRHRGGKRVAWRLHRPSDFQNAGRRIAGGWDGALPFNYGRTPQEMLDILEARRVGNL